MVSSHGFDPVGSLCFWYEPVIKEFSQPEYFIGELVFHIVQVVDGYILYPVKVLGLCWTGLDWEYAVELPVEHPYYIADDCEVYWVNEGYLEKL